MADEMEKKSEQKSGTEAGQESEPKPKSEQKPKPTEVERLEARQKRLDDAKKENSKKLRAAKRRAARKADQAKKQAEIDEAVMFLKFARQHKIYFGQGENRHSKLMYDWIKGDYEKWKKESQDDVAPGRAQ